MFQGRRAKQGLTQASESSSETCLSLLLRDLRPFVSGSARKGTVPARRLARTVPFLLCPRALKRQHQGDTPFGGRLESGKGIHHAIHSSNRSLAGVHRPACAGAGIQRKESRI